MRKIAIYNQPDQPINPEALSHHDPVMWLNSNSPDSPDFLATGKINDLVTNEEGFVSLKTLWEEQKDWLFGYFSYDLKNGIEDLRSANFDGLKFPDMHFFQPAVVLVFHNGKIEAHFDEKHSSEAEVDQIIRSLTAPSKPLQETTAKLRPRITKEDYLRTVKQLQQHIQAGDVYEVNFCQEFFAEDAVIDPFSVYQKLNAISPTPFSCFYRNKDHYLMCASPERFLQKQGNRLISQPIKGTAPRHTDPALDEQIKQELLTSAKEQRENVMIVDLVRNDLSRSAGKESVKVEELFGVYSFPQVHQLISTISCELRDNIHFIDAIKSAFPMGSMTGAPKISAMKLIEKYESMKRGLFSGAVGYITPGGDFDFNVVIRSLLYNTAEKYLSCSVGGAITAKSVPEKEHEECLLKAKAAFEALEQSTRHLPAK